MDCCTPPPPRRHNPVDSICRKLQTIQWRGDREPNSPFQIPKLSSSSYDSPQCSLRSNLEAILKKGAFHRDQRGTGARMGMPSSVASQRSAAGHYTPTRHSSTPANVTYSITSTLGERHRGEGRDLGQTWQKYHSTPSTQPKDSPYFTFTRGPQSGQSDSDGPSSSPHLSRTFTPSRSTFSYNLNFCSADGADAAESELPYPALVVKRLSMGEGGTSVASENGTAMAEISLICEENLLDTIFHACDTQRRGKVFVSHIVDYLRHTTSRSSEDSGLEELCNMLDPERKDVSIDLDTYHAVMREWIDDCRNNGQEESEDMTQEDSVKVRDGVPDRKSMLLNMTSGSLEAFGGEASRAEFETSELVYCVADLQMGNQKLQEEVRKLKQVVEGMEESNQKLAEENEELRTQARINQQMAQKEKLLKEEVEEMKATLSCTEEGRARASAHSKHVERENQSLMAKISSLEDENFKITMETDELQKRIKELCDLNADLQVQIHAIDAILNEKESVIVERDRQVEELKAAVEEYSAITELLRMEKSKLENQMQMILPDLAGSSLSLCGAYRLNQSSSGSLQTELALAQSPLEAPHGVDHLSAVMSQASPLDETLDREVLLLLQGPDPEHMALEFRNLLNKLKKDLEEESCSVVSTVRGFLGSDVEPRLQTVRAELDARRADWADRLDQLAQYTDSLEKELIKMASNMRRSRTEILHLSVRVQEQENQKRQLREDLELLKAPQDAREVSCQTPEPEEEPGEDLDWEEEFALQDFLKNELAERNCGAPERREAAASLPDRCDEEETWTVESEAKEDGGGRDISTPLSAVFLATPTAHPSVADGRDAQPEENHQPLQKAAAAPLDAHSQAVSAKHPEADALPDLSHSEKSDEVCGGAESPSCGPEPAVSSSSEQEQTITPADMLLPNTTATDPEDTLSLTESSLLTCEELGGEEEKSEAGSSAADMRRHKSLIRDGSAERPAAEDGSCLLPVLVEEEESAQDTAAQAEDVTRLPRSENLVSNSSSPTATSITADSPTGRRGSRATSDPRQPETDQEFVRNMSAAEEQKGQDERSESSRASERDSETSVLSDTSEAFREERNSLSPNDKEIEAEFQRLSLGFKCDMFTLEKRLKLEQRSRDLAEENIRKEVSSCQGLLQALTPLCEDDTQSMEIIQRLQKNLDILIQSTNRVSSRSEMLGAIHQENRIGKAVEVMIQHVENLKRTYTKEHAELLELREALMQNERSFGSQTERDDFRGRKQTSNNKTRRFSTTAIPYSGYRQLDMVKTQETSEGDMEKLNRRSPWNMAAKGAARYPLKRFGSSAARFDSEDPPDPAKGTACSNGERQPADHQQPQEEETERRPSLSELGSKLTAFILPVKTPSPPSSPTASDQTMVQPLSHDPLDSRRVSAAAVAARASRGLWLWLAIVVVLAGLLALLACLVMQPAADAAPVGTGDSWMTIQQLLWPYTGLRHNAQPPV
uniref:Lymphoid-restricted membrane protein n=1 Tax=Oryzias melastigma TaxID=30732 RepID=A0A3B3B5J0_ORYME